MRKTVLGIKQSKQQGDKLTMLTAYDSTMATILSKCDVDILLVGDSLGMVMLGYDSTVTVTMDEMIHHAAAVRRGAPEAFVVGDLPFGAYQESGGQAIRNGVRFLKEAGCDAVKLEGGLEVCPTVEAMVKAGVSVMGHIGLTPQTASQLGGYKVQGKTLDSARLILEEAKGLEEAGAFCVLMECVPTELATLITESLSIPTIGIGAGDGCDGQVLVTQDLLGMFDKFKPKFVKTYVDISTIIQDSVNQYCDEVRGGRFPDSAHSFASSCDLDELIKE